MSTVQLTQGEFDSLSECASLPRAFVVGTQWKTQHRETGFWVLGEVVEHPRANGRLWLDFRRIEVVPG